MDRGAWWATVHEVAKSCKRVTNTLSPIYILSIPFLLPITPPTHTHSPGTWNVLQKSIRAYIFHIWSNKSLKSFLTFFEILCIWKYTFKYFLWNITDIKIEGKIQPPENATRLANPIILSSLMFISTQSKIVGVILAWNLDNILLILQNWKLENKGEHRVFASKSLNRLYQEKKK